MSFDMISILKYYVAFWHGTKTFILILFYAIVKVLNQLCTYSTSMILYSSVWWNLICLGRSKLEQKPEHKNTHSLANNNALAVLFIAHACLLARLQYKEPVSCETSVQLAWLIRFWEICSSIKSATIWLSKWMQPVLFLNYCTISCNWIFNLLDVCFTPE